MSLQTLYISKRCHLKIDKNQLVIEGCYKVHVPIEDIASLVLESQQITITSACLSTLARLGSNVIICGADHHPNALQLPFLPHSRQALVNRKQAEWSESFKKRCHQKIIQNKIQNQAICFELLNKKNKKLYELAEQVKLGDKTNCESYAASLYFNCLLKGKSRRNKDYYYNKALNYGYAIIRSRIAQALTASGFIPSMGLFHQNDLNNFNLADDIIEPYRAFIDHLIMSKFHMEKKELEKKDKSLILKIPEMEIHTEDNENFALSQLIKNSVHSLRKATDANNCNLLSFPEFQPLQERYYE